MTAFYGDFILPANYCTPDDVAEWMGGRPMPDTISGIVRSCTRLVLKAVQGAFYDADPVTGLPTDALDVQAMKDATCIQAAAWVTLDIDPYSGGVVEAGTIQSSVKLGTATITDVDAAAAAAARARAHDRLVPEAAQLLQQRNLIGTGVWSFG